MKLLSKTLISILSLSFFSVNIMANNPNSFDYFGLSFQQNSYNNLNFSPGINASEFTPLIYNASSSEKGNRIFLGHQFNRYIAIESGVTSLGKAKFYVIQEETGDDGNTEKTTVQSGSFKTIAGDLRIVGTLPVSDHMFLKAHVGAYLWDNEFTVLSRSNDLFITEKTSESGVSLLTGLGIGYGFNDVIAISLDFEKTKIAEITNQNTGLSIFMKF